MLISCKNMNNTEIRIDYKNTNDTKEETQNIRNTKY